MTEEVEEEWRPIAEFPHYLVSNLGRVKHAERNEPRKITTDVRGRAVIALLNNPDPTRYLRQVDKLVATAFLPEPFYHDEINVWHKNGDFSDCRVDNLQWERRDRVLEWNDMNRRGKPKFVTPKVKNNRTGVIYENAYECGMAEGMLESAIIWRVERQAMSVYDDNARYRYITE